MINCTTKQLKYFILACEVKSLQKVADILMLDRANISKEIKILEERLGFKLFTRKNNKIFITEGGEALYEVLSKSFDQLEKLIAKYQEGQSKEKILIDIMYPEAMDMHKKILFDITKDKNIDFIYNSFNFAEIKKRLTSGISDVAITYDFHMETDSKIVKKDFIALNPEIIISNSHPLAKEKRITKELLEYLKFYAFSNKDFPNAGKYIKQIANQIGFEPFINYDFVDFPSILIEIEQGKGATILDSSFIANTESIKAISLKEFNLENTGYVSVFYRKSNAHLDLINIFIRCFEEYSITRKASIY